MVSEANISCKFCKVTGRFRDIRIHIKRTHNLFSSIQCKQGACNFECAHSFKCFGAHSSRIHQQLFEGRATVLGDGNFFELVTDGEEINESIHSEYCKQETISEGKKKKVEIRLRGLAEKRILAKFAAITAEVRVDISAAYELYFEAFEDIDNLNKKFPMVQKRSKAVSFYDKEMEKYMKIYQAFEDEFARNCLFEE